MLFLKLKKNGNKLENRRKDTLFVVYLKKKHCSWLIWHDTVHEIIWEWQFTEMLIHNPVGHNLQDTIYETMWMSKFIEI